MIIQETFAFWILDHTINTLSSLHGAKIWAKVKHPKAYLAFGPLVIPDFNCKYSLIIHPHTVQKIPELSLCTGSCRNFAQVDLIKLIWNLETQNHVLLPRFNNFVEKNILYLDTQSSYFYVIARKRERFADCLFHRSVAPHRIFFLLLIIRLNMKEDFRVNPIIGPESSFHAESAWKAAISNWLFDLAFPNIAC